MHIYTRQITDVTFFEETRYGSKQSVVFLSVYWEDEAGYRWYMA